MAYRYLIYSIGTTFTSTILRESVINNPGVNEASFYTNFLIPEIQPLYLWRVDNPITPTDVIPNTDGNISAYLNSIATPPSYDDNITYGEVTGITKNKINIVTGATNKIAIFKSDGNLQDGGYTIPQITGLTAYSFIGSGNTSVIKNGNVVLIYSPTGDSSAVWGNITGVVSNQTDLWADLQLLSGATTANTANIIQNYKLFTGFTASTGQNFQNVSNDINYISGVTDTKLNINIFNNYTGNTKPIIDNAITGITNLGSGYTLGNKIGKDITLKSLSAVGGVKIIGDVNNIIISGETNISPIWGNITGTLSNQVDLWNILTSLSGETESKLDIDVFTGYTAATNIKLNNIENDISYISGVTDTKLDISVFSVYTGQTKPILDSAITGASNGLSYSNRIVEFGGNLTKNTSVEGITFGLTANTKNIHLQSVDGINIIDTTNGTGINIESDGGIIKLSGKNNLGVEKTRIEISDSQLLITDNRATKFGLQYSGDYSNTFTDESLVTKRYVDLIASGLLPKEAVLVATTSPITLSGLITVDGVALTNGDRVLVKNQSNAVDNGIYIATGGTWTRAKDFDDLPDVEVTSGNIIPVISGNTNKNTLWVLITPNPVVIGTSSINFTLFTSPYYTAGHGIGISGSTIYVDGNSLAGSSILWSGGTFNVDPTSGTLANALNKKLDVSTFSGYTAITQTILNNSITGATNGLETNGRNVILGGNLCKNTVIDGLKSYSLGIVGVNEFQVSTNGGISGVTFGLDKSGLIFNVSGTTVELSDNEGLKYGGDYSSNYTARSLVDKAYVTGQTAQLISEIDYISGITNTKLNIKTFTGYTASTITNQIQLIHTGGTNINTITSTPIVWHNVLYSGNSFTWTGGTNVKINKTSDYEVSYHILFSHSGTNNIRGIASNLLVNGTTILNNTGAAGTTARSGVVGDLILSNTVISLNNGDVINLIAYRTGLAGTSNTMPNGVLLIKEKNKLQ